MNPGAAKDPSPRPSLFRKGRGSTIGTVRRRSNCVLFALGLVCSVHGGPRYYVDKVWTSDDGLPENAVIAMTQTHDGYLWLGTLNGLARFDGLQFSVFDEGNTPGLSSPRVVRLFEDSQGNLWIGTETAGVALVDKKGTVTSINIGAHTREGRLLSVCEDSTGAVWLYTADGQLARARDGRLDRWGPDPPSNCRALVADDSGLVWVGMDSRLTAYGPFTSGVSVGLPEALTIGREELGKLDLLLASKRGGYWRLANHLVQKCKGEAVERQFAYPWSTNVAVSVACEDREGNLIVGTLSEGVFVFDAAGQFTRLTKEQGLSDNYILSLCVDREGTLWIGTDGGGLIRAKPQVFEVLKGPGDSPAQSVCEDARGGLWLGFNGGGAAYWKEGVLKSVPLPSGLPSYVKAILVDREQTVWAGTRGGLFQFQQSAWVHVTLPLPQAPQRPEISTLYQDRAGRLWVGTQKGLARWDGQAWRSFTISDGLSVNAVQAIADDAAGDLWVGTEGGGLDVLRDGHFVVLRRDDGLPSDNINSLYLDAEGVLWVGTSSGLARYSQGKWSRLSKEQGLISDSIGYLLEDREGCLWIGSNAGLMRTRREHLFHSGGASADFPSARAYGKSDGLPSGECTFGSQPAACRARAGRLWFPTIKGLASIEPQQLRLNTNPPPVMIEAARIDGRLQHTNTLRSPPPQSVTVPAGSEALEIDYTSLNLSAPEKGRFRYRLQGYETAWTEEPGNKRSVRYSLLPPRDFVFQVTACNEDEVWNPASATLRVKVLPPFWRTWWFLGLTSAALLGLVVGSVHYVSTQRLQRQLESLRQKEAIERERSRIARDIHDQVGANLTQVSLLGELVESDKDEPSEVEAHGRQISQTALETTRALDEIVWTVNPSNDTLDSLITYICKYTQDYLAVAGLRYRLEVPEQLPGTVISPELRHNVFLAAKEAVNNVVKHAQASAVWLRLHLEPHRFVLEIEDNGRGLSAADEKKGRNGLRNMRKRMEDIGGGFEAEPGAEGGTRVRLVAPL